MSIIDIYIGYFRILTFIEYKMDPITQDLTGARYTSFDELMVELRSTNSLGGEGEKCSICLEQFDRNQRNIVILSKCRGHYFHDTCINQCRQGAGFVKCPNCMTVYGIQTGKMPTGTMNVTIRQGKVPGFNCSSYFKIDYVVEGITIDQIDYSRTERTAYLPDTVEGERALSLLTIAFQRGLTFIPSRSVTNGQYTVTWAIHHKTKISGGEYGYPDPTYLQRLTDELNARGVLFS